MSIRLVTDPEESSSIQKETCAANGFPRVGAVSYLNSKPLIEGLEKVLPAGNLHLNYPSRLADDLSAGRLDVALIPSVEYFYRDDYKIISDACVATHGPVLSVKLYTRVPWGEIRTLALDEGSRTSIALSRVLLAERYGVEPELFPLPMSQSTTDTNCDAILLIGDRAIHSPVEKFAAIWDLGEEWVNWTGFPFVFAMWVASTSLDSDQIEPLLCKARDNGLMNIEKIAKREAKQLELTQQAACSYLKKNLHFKMGSAERRGLELFQQLASNLNTPD